MTQTWRAVRASVFLTSRGEFGGASDELLSLSAAHGIRRRNAAEGRAPSEDLSGYRRVRRGDLVVNKLVARDGALAVSTLDGCISPAYWVLRVDQGIAEPKFIHYALRSHAVLEEIGKRSKDAPPAQFDLPWEQFKTMPVLLPTLADQRRIVAFLDAETDRIDALIRAQERLVVTLRERRAGIVDEMLRSAAAEEVQRAMHVRLKHVAAVRVSGVDKKSLDGQVAVRLCNYTDVYKREIIRSTDEFMIATATDAQAVALALAPGDSVITKDSETAEDIGIPAFVESVTPDLLCGYHLAIIRPNARAVFPRFLYWALKSRQTAEYWEVAATGTTRVGLRTSDIESLPIVVPSLNVQTRVSARLDVETSSIDELAQRALAFVEILKERRGALISAAVTGQLDCEATVDARWS